MLRQSILVLSCLATGCLTSDLKEMHDSTQEMDRTTKAMDEKLAETRETLEHKMSVLAGIQDLSAAAYMDLRQGDSVTSRRNALKAMDGATDILAKATEAGIYFMSFEFQLWKPFESLELRESLSKLAVMEFFNKLSDYIPARLTIDPTSNDNRVRNAMALSAALHFLNPNQELLVHKGNVKPIHFLGLLSEGLAAKQPIDSGARSASSFPEWVHGVLEHEAEATYLLRSRANVLAAAALPRISELEETGFLGIPGLIRKAHARFFDWNPDFSDLTNSVQVTAVAECLEESARTRDFLRSLGIDPKFDSDLQAVYDNVEVKVPNLTASSSVRDQAFARLAKGIRGLKQKH